MLFPSSIRVGNVRSIVDPATQVAHGTTFWTVDGSGPSFPAEKITDTPLCTAWNDPISELDEKNGRSGGDIPREAEITWTPSQMASS